VPGLRSYLAGGRLVAVLWLTQDPRQSGAPYGSAQAGGAVCSGRTPLVLMMKTAELRDRNDGAIVGRRDWTRNGCLCSTINRARVTFVREAAMALALDLDRLPGRRLEEEVC
jgi:hypothetical protein